MKGDKFTSCADLQKYVRAKTGIDVHVTRTQTYAYFNYAKGGELRTSKVKITAGVFYCMTEKDLKPLIAEMKST